jgi:hypothetical protein
MEALHYENTYGDPPHPDLALACDHFAQSFFTSLQQRSACQSLNALVMGLEMRLSQDLNREHCTEYEPIRCYSKGRLMDLYGAGRDWPYLVRLFEFRATCAYTEIMDQHSPWGAEDEWMWRVPGRFHDV